ncbi:MAG: hypothetical protein LBP73_07765, partial [Clostridiales Family XIII bacterium]|nr:hypothetical protein [Clostridiales Family XIII bacterium]
MPGDTLHSEEQRRISNAFRVLITNDTETARHGEISQDYHMHGTVHEGEQFFFSNAYNRGEESLYGIKSAARRFDAGLAPAALDETASKSERKKKRQEHEAAKKRWEDAKRKQARYDAASERLEARILEERVKGAGSENDVLSVPSDYDEVMAADASENAALAEKRAAYRRYETDPRYRLLLRKENRWIGIPLATRSEDEMSRLPEEEKAEVMEADAFYEEMFAGINRARDFMAEGYAATGGRDVESQKIYGRLTRRLAEAANSYALNEREVKARQKIGLAIPDGADPETEAVLMACQAKAEVQRQIRNILREEIRTIVRLIEVARDPDSEALTDGDVRYLSLNGIETDAFREIRDRRERRAAEIAQAREEEAQRRQEAERLRLEEERRAEAQRRAEKEAERKRLLLEAAMEFKGAVDERLAAFSRRASDVRSELTALQKGATREAAETVEQLAALQREIKDFLEADGYAGDLQEALRESVAAAAEKQADVDNAVATSFALYRFRTKEDHRSLADGTTEARVDLLVDAEASEYCDAASSAEFNQMIEDDINGDTELRKVVDGLNSDLQNIRDILDRAKNAADEYDTRISRKERIEYMKKLDAALSDLEKQKAELRLLDVEAGAEAEDRKRDLHRRLFDKRADGYGAAAAAVTENIAALVFAKYERAIRRRTDIERSLPKTADAILTERIARASLSDAEVGELLKRIAEGRVTGEDVNALRENFNVFLTKKYRENEELDAILDKVAAEDGVVLDVDKAALSAAVRYIVTTEKTPDLEGALKTASAETLEELRRDLDALDPEAETGLKINGREAANNIGAKLGALHRIARKNLIASDLAAFEERLNAVSQGHLQGMKDQLAGAYAYTDHPYLDRLLLDAELHSGILRRLGALEPQEQTAILEKIYGDKAGMLAATDELLIGQEDLDDLAIFLKAKLLKAHAGPAGEPDEREMYSMTARHDASRLVRSCRGFLRDVKDKRPDDLALADRMDWLNGLGDKALIEALLRGNAAGSIPGMRFMYLSAYALMLSAEKGERVSAEEIQATEAGKACSADMIKAALTSGLANEEQYGKAADLLRKQASVYDGERLGNRVMNFFGDLIGRDLSRER